MLVSMQMLNEKLNRIEQMLERFLEENEVNSIEEISLNKAAKILHRSTRFITYEVQAGRLKAIKYRDKSRRLRYRFRLSDIKEYQKTRETRDLKLEYSGPTTEEICNSIFNNNRKVQ